MDWYASSSEAFDSMHSMVGFLRLLGPTLLESPSNDDDSLLGLLEPVMVRKEGLIKGNKRGHEDRLGDKEIEGKDGWRR